jgi:uncharacterized protein (TIGR03118 family)
MLSVLCVVLLHGVVGTATAQYGGGGSGGSGGMPHAPAPSSPYTLTNLVGDAAGAAAQVDPHLVNAWGLVAGPSTPWWVANNATGSSTLYTGTGAVVPLVVAVPGAPTGIVFNGGNGFVISNGSSSGPAAFIFATESGVVSGWNQAVPPPPPATQALTGADRSGEGAIYKGLTIASTAAGDQLYATDFHNARVDVFDSSFNLVTAPGAFVDKKIPRRFAPFGIQNIGGAIFVTYAKQDKAKVNDVPGATHGFVDMFDTSGNLMARVATKGPLNAPWGLARAPSDFGTFSGDLLVGNFGNGRINAYHQQSNGRWKFRGPLKDSQGKVLRIDGLWACRSATAARPGRRTRYTSPPAPAEGPTGSSEASSPPADSRRGSSSSWSWAGVRFATRARLNPHDERPHDRRLLALSNLFMTVAWYGHLRFRTAPIALVILASWGLHSWSTASRCRRIASGTGCFPPISSRSCRRRSRSSSSWASRPSGWAKLCSSSTSSPSRSSSPPSWSHFARARPRITPSRLSPRGRLRGAG